MGIFLGDKPVSVYFNGAAAGLPVQGVFLGGIQVFPTGTAATVPGAPTIVVAYTDVGDTVVVFSVPDDGGSEITSYKYYFDGVEAFPIGFDDSSIEGQILAFFTGEKLGQDAEVSAVNAIGEGPKSDPFTVVVGD
jgi:hypothetical protein